MAFANKTSGNLELRSADHRVQEDGSRRSVYRFAAETFTPKFVIVYTDDDRRFEIVGPFCDRLSMNAFIGEAVRNGAKRVSSGPALSVEEFFAR